MKLAAKLPIRMPAAGLLGIALLSACAPAPPPSEAYPSRVTLDDRNLVLNWAEGGADCVLAPDPMPERHSQYWDIRPLDCPDALPGMRANIFRIFTWSPVIDPVYVETPPPRLTGRLDLRNQSAQLTWATVTIYGTDEAGKTRHGYAIYTPGSDFERPALQAAEPAPPKAR